MDTSNARELSRRNRSRFRRDFRHPNRRPGGRKVISTHPAILKMSGDQNPLGDLGKCIELVPQLLAKMEI